MFAGAGRRTWMEDKCERGGEARLMIVLLAAIVRTMDLTLSGVLRIPAGGKKRNLLVERILPETKI